MTRDFEWIRSPFCGNGACVEVARAGRVILVRDSKAPASGGGVLQPWAPPEWCGLIAAIKAGAAHPAINVDSSGDVRLGFVDAGPNQLLLFDAVEWAAFVAGVKAGVFDLDKLSSPAPVAQQGADGAGRSAGLGLHAGPGEAATGAGMAGNPLAPVAAEYGPATGAADAAVGRPRRDSGAAASPSPTSAPVAADLGLPPGQASSRIEVRAGHDPLLSAGELVPAGGSPTLCGPNGFAPIVPAGWPSPVHPTQVSPPQEAVRPGPGPFVPTDLFAPTVEEVEELAAVLAEASRSYALLADGGEPSALVVARYLLAAGYVRAAVMPPPEVTEHWCQVVTGPAWGSGPLVEHISDIESSRGRRAVDAGSVPAQSRAGDVEGSAGPGLPPRGSGPADQGARAFHLGDVLSVTTGLLVSNRHMDGVHDVLDWMTGDSLFTHQLPRAVDEAKPEILRQHPDLADVPVPEDFAGKANVEAWLAEQVARFGEYRELTPLAAGDHAVIDPITELRMMAPDKPIIVVTDDAS